MITTHIGIVVADTETAEHMQAMIDPSRRKFVFMSPLARTTGLHFSTVYIGADVRENIEHRTTPEHFQLVFDSFRRWCKESLWCRLEPDGYIVHIPQ